MTRPLLILAFLFFLLALPASAEPTEEQEALIKVVRERTVLFTIENNTCLAVLHDSGRMAGDIVVVTCRETEPHWVGKRHPVGPQIVWPKEK